MISRKGVVLVGRGSFVHNPKCDKLQLFPKGWDQEALANNCWYQPCTASWVPTLRSILCRGEPVARIIVLNHEAAESDDGGI